VGPGREGEVSLRVTVAGEPVLELKRQRVQGFATLRGELPERSSAGRILFDIEGGTAAAHFCFDGDLRPRSPLAKALKPPTVSTNPTTKPVTKAPAAKPGAAVATPPAKPAANSPAPPAKPSVRP
jgi:hypothetical protein